MVTVTDKTAKTANSEKAIAIGFTNPKTVNSSYTTGKREQIIYEIKNIGWIYFFGKNL